MAECNCLAGTASAYSLFDLVFMQCAEAGMETQRWHELAANLAGIASSAAPTALPFSLTDIRTDQTAAAVQQYSCNLGRIEDLVQELGILRLKCAALSSVSASDTSVTLVFLGLEAELKFSVQVEIGELLAMHAADVLC